MRCPFSAQCGEFCSATTLCFAEGHTLVRSVPILVARTSYEHFNGIRLPMTRSRDTPQTVSYH